MDHPLNVVIAGGGLAALRTAERLRARGYDGGLTLVSDEGHLPYDRPPLSKQVLRGESTGQPLLAQAELAARRIDVLLDDAATAVDPAARTVTTAAGVTIPYGALVIATGATARRVPGLDGQALRTLADARALRADLQSAAAEGRSITVVGAGLIGCEVAASATALGVGVDLVDLETGPMIRVVGPVVAAEIARLQVEHGVRLHLGTAATRTAAGTLRTAAGTELAGDLVLEAVGSRPNVDWLSASGLPLDDGLPTDPAGRVVDGIWALGDVARWAGTRHEHWTAAVNQADQVAASILGAEVAAEEVAYWWSDQWDLKIQGIGSPAADDEVALLKWGPRQRLLAVYSAAGATTGAVGFSAQGAIAKLRQDIIARTPVAEVLARLQG